MTYTSIPELYELFVNCQQKVTTDTRKLENGSIFFALKGDNFDANTFVQSAIDGGCAYAVTDNGVYANGKTILLVQNVLKTLQQLAKHHRRQLQIPIIGITGSNGKTTNKELICAVLSKKYNVYATKGNLNNHIGVPLTLLAISPLHEMAIVEMGANHQGEIELLSDLADPDFGIITNIGKAHLEGFGGVEGIKKGKSELYKHLRNKKGTVFINGNDAVLVELAGEIDKVRYGEDESFYVHGKLFSNSEYVEFKWNTKNNPVSEKPLVKTKMFGHYNFINMLCAATIGYYFRVPEFDINAALAEYSPEMNRSQVLKTTHNTLILDAYNANPSSMGLAIHNFTEQHFNQSLIILGDMLELGEYSDSEHETILNQLVSLNVKEVLLVGELFLQFEKKYPFYYFFKDTENAILHLQKHLISGKTILIKGSRGIRLEKIANFL